jgi:ADP-ribose pyrophosphatase YjhB (NUDIX family)
MPTLKSRLGDWELPNVHAWSERELLIRAPEDRLIGPATKVATIGSCFASELASMMKKTGIVGGMHPGGLFYSTATIRQEMERLAGGWTERAGEPSWAVPGGFVDPFRDYGTTHADEAVLLADRSAADAAADELFRDAKVVVATLGLIETFRNPATGNTYRGIPHPAVYPSVGAEFHRLTVTDMLSDLERIRAVVRDTLGATLVLTTSPVPLHTTFTAHDVRVANMESKSRIRAAVSECVERYPDVRYFHSYEMVVTAERQSDYFREDGRHVHRHAVKYIVSEFLRLFGDPALQMADVDTTWLTPIEKTAATVAPQAPLPKPPRPPVSFPRRVARKVRREVRSALGRA